MNFPFRRTAQRLFSVLSVTLIAHCGGTTGPLGFDQVGQDPAAAGSGGSAGNQGAGGSVQGSGGTGLRLCTRLDTTVEPLVPTVVLLFDQSGTLAQPYPGSSPSQSQWEMLRNTFLGDSGVVKSLNNEVRFGLTLYTSTDANAANGTCPVLSNVDINIMNYDKIKAFFAMNTPKEDTPTSNSIHKVVEVLTKERGPKYILLATDGDPDSCAYPDPLAGSEEEKQTRQAVLDATQRAWSLGIGTFVININGDVDKEHLKAVARVGAGMNDTEGSQARVYRPTEQAALIDLFRTIINTNCVFSLNQAVTPSDAEKATVLLDKKALIYQTGWRLKSAREIELLDNACEAMKTGSHTISATFPCDAKAN